MSIKLLDCTLRDGGYINDWNFGRSFIQYMLYRLLLSQVDIIEIGFINESRKFDYNRTVFPDAISTNLTLEKYKKGKTKFFAMIDYGTCDIVKIQNKKDTFLDGIRVIFKKNNMMSAIEYGRKLQEKGYLVSLQMVSVTSYLDKDVLNFCELVNNILPYSVGIVDTYGLMHKEQAKHYFELLDYNLNKNIAIGYHSHNNFQLAYANCIEVMELTSLERDIVIDGTLYGMGKSAGNAPLELLATYMNDNLGKNYHCSQLLEAIDVTMLELYKQIPWGYSFKFFLSASKDCHPNYVTYLMDKKKLSIKSINEILDKLEWSKRLSYDQAYVEKLYVEYQKEECDDTEDKERLKSWLQGREVLVFGPGSHIVEQRDKIEKYLSGKTADKIIRIAINFIPVDFSVDAVFISNSKRYVSLSTKLSQSTEQLTTLATSNVTRSAGTFDYVFNYSGILDEQAMIVDNPMIMLLKLLREASVSGVSLAGFDGYVKAAASNYVNPNMDYSFSKEKAAEINQDVRDSMERLGVLGFEMKYITDTLYC